MSGEIDYRRATNPAMQGPARHFLSDITYGGFSSYHGTWYGDTPANMSVVYDTLPPEPGLLSRIHYAGMVINQVLAFEFNAPQNLNEYLLEWWWRRTVGSPIYLYFALKPFATWTTGPYLRYNLASVALPWTKESKLIGRPWATISSALNPSALLSKVKTIAWYAGNNQGDADMAGVNIRRLP